MPDMKPGDVVRLKSGGPQMTVTTVEDLYGVLTAWTTWFEKTKVEKGTFPVAALDKES